VTGVVLVGGPVAVVLPGPLYAVLVAPPLEEAAKLLGALAVIAVFRRLVEEPVDAVVYATTIGFGFAAAENVQYFTAASGDPGLLAVLFVVRSVGTAVMHGVAAGLAGLAIGRRRLGHPRGRVWMHGWVTATLVHGAWNLFAYLGTLGLALGVLLLVLSLVVYVRGFRELLAFSPHALAALPPPWQRRWAG
jgi:RsiW-degrading membrane proteinase PrsW (M82 family)